MNKKSWIGVGLVSIFVFIFFMSYQLHQEGLFNFNKHVDENLQIDESSSITIGGIAEVIDILSSFNQSYLQYNRPIEIQLNEGEPEELIRGLEDETYDIIVTPEKMDEDEINLNLYQELLFGVLHTPDENYLDQLIYCYVSTHDYQQSEVKEYLKLFYSQAVSFLNTNHVYALQSTIYEETLTYLETLDFYSE